MASQTDNTQQWEPCQGGQLRQAIRQIQLRRRNRTVARLSAAAVLLLLAAGAGGPLLYRQLHQPCPDSHAGMSCAEVRAHMADYVAHRLDAAMAEKVRMHLASCPECARRYEEMTRGAAGPRAVRPAPHRHDAARGAAPVVAATLPPAALPAAASGRLIAWPQADERSACFSGPGGQGAAG